MGSTLKYGHYDSERTVSKGWALQAKGKYALSQTHRGSKYKEENAHGLKTGVLPVRNQQPKSCFTRKTEHNGLLAFIDLEVAALSGGPYDTSNISFC